MWSTGPPSLLYLSLYCCVVLFYFYNDQGQHSQTFYSQQLPIYECCLMCLLFPHNFSSSWVARFLFLAASQFFTVNYTRHTLFLFLLSINTHIGFVVKASVYAGSPLTLVCQQSTMYFLLVISKCKTCLLLTNFLDKMSKESTRLACRGMTSASGHARALEAASSRTKKHGRRNKKSPNC